MGGPVLREREGPISLILYCYSTVIVNRDTIFFRSHRASGFIPAPTEPKTRELVICLDASVSFALTVISMRPSVEEVVDADPAADLAAEEENKLINEVYMSCPPAKVVAC